MTGDYSTKHFAWPTRLLPVIQPTDLGYRSAQIPPGMIRDDHIAHAMGTTRRQVVRLRSKGLTYFWADRLATKVLGMHPCEVWPTWWDVTEAELERHQLIEFNQSSAGRMARRNRRLMERSQ